jgi:hypothetical protein
VLCFCNDLAYTHMHIAASFIHASPFLLHCCSLLFVRSPPCLVTWRYIRSFASLIARSKHRPRAPGTHVDSQSLPKNQDDGKEIARGTGGWCGARYTWSVCTLTTGVQELDVHSVELVVAETRVTRGGIEVQAPKRYLCNRLAAEGIVERREISSRHSWSSDNASFELGRGGACISHCWRLLGRATAAREMERWHGRSAQIAEGV